MDEKKEIIDYVTKGDIDRNVNFFLKWSLYVLYFCVIVGGILIFAGLINIENSDGESFAYALIGAVVLFNGYILENLLKWLAFMLYTNYKKIK